MARRAAKTVSIAIGIGIGSCDRVSTVENKQRPITIIDTDSADDMAYAAISKIVHTAICFIWTEQLPYGSAP